ncbi:hypothetical protein [[Bacillus] enclensis]|uniref:hypothetical protein n=1 Tax=[Bacillus] enclensis TaxID=1402860 RepID=UPI0018DC8D85|nr:hypothetical protein [[Bacillus] enclensis]MBH9968198.1 hypothetical protein [[Bacillus] enclensis]
MKHLKSQSGYALVLALLIIVVIMAVALFLMGRSYTSVKQNGVVEGNYQSVALAEMGVSYFELAVKNGFDKNKENIMQNMRTQMNTDLAKGNLKEQSYYIEQALYDMSREVESYLIETLKPTTAAGDLKESTLYIEDALYKISYSSLNPISNKIQIPFTSVGVKDEKRARLSGTITIPVTVDPSDSDDDTDVGAALSFDKITRPDEKDEGVCTTPDKKLKKCPEYLFKDNDYEFSGNFNNSDIHLIYADGTLELDGNGNKADIDLMHVNGDLKLVKNMNHSTIGYLEVKGNLVLNSQFRLSNSEVYIKEYLKAGDDGSPGNQGGHFELTDNSFMYVGKNAEIGKKFTIDSGSTMCVGGGSITFNQNSPEINVSGNLYIKDTGGVKQSNVEKYFVSPDVFNNACGVDQGQIHTIGWGDIQKTVDYEYE